MAFVNSAVVNYPVEEVFRVFIRTAKRDFPKFNEENPIGCSVEKKVGAYSVNSAKLKVEILDYKKNELYKIVSSNDQTAYYSTYEFEVVDENSTRITLTELDEQKGLVTWVNRLVQTIAFKGRVKRRFIYFIETLEREIERMRENLAKNSKSRSEEEAKIKAKEEAKKAKEMALKAEKEAKEAKLAAEKAMEEARKAQEEAEKMAEAAKIHEASSDEDITADALEDTVKSE